jgi:hypothetical protein
LLVINDLEKYMQALRLDPIDHLQHWNLFAHMKGLVLEAGGDNAGAADWLERGGAVHDGKLDLERVRAKMH